MDTSKSVAEWMSELGISLEALLEATGMEPKLIRAIASGQYTPSPQQRHQLAAALGVEANCIEWSHASSVQHIYGHGPQFGRSP